MQRQQIISNGESDLSSNQNKQHSRSVHRLYNRMGNNIRVLNKSRVSNRSNNSIGSVALRRTELSNDKIYSRQQDFLVNDSREVDFQSQINNIRRSINTNNKGQESLQSDNNKYRQRIKLSKQSFSRRSQSQKSYRHNKGVTKKPTKHQIQKLFMMEDHQTNNIIGGYTNKQSNLKYNNLDANQRQHSAKYQQGNNYKKENKESIRSSRQKQYDNSRNNNNSNIRSYKFNKSSLKSNIKSSKNLSKQSKNINNRYYHKEQSSMINGSQIEKMSKKQNYNHSKRNDINQKKYHQNKQQYDNYYLQQRKNNNNFQPSQYQIQRKKNHNFKDNYYYNENQKLLQQIKKDKLSKDCKLRQHKQQSSRQRLKQDQYHKLHKYKSQKYLSTTNDSEIMYIKRPSKNKNIVKDQVQRNRNQYDRKREAYYQNKNKQSSSKHRYPQRQFQPLNSFEKYQRQQWQREQNRRYVKETHKPISQKLLLMEQSSISQEKRENKYNRQKHRHHQNNTQRSSILFLRSKNSDSQFKKDIRIKQNSYAYLYGERESEVLIESKVRRSSKKLSYKKDSQQSKLQYQMSPRTPKTHQQQNEYYAHMMTPTSQASTKNYLSLKHSPTTQISSTLDSLLLSINSHISLSQNQRSSTSTLIDKLNIHIKTLQIISDYSKEFKKMYEDIQQWQELIFLSYKKYWVERVKVIEYLKKYIVPSKRHKSQRINLKVPQSKDKNTKNNQPLSSPIIEDPFSSNTLLQNPFTIPFCKLSQQQLNKLSSSAQAANFISQLEQQTSQVYKHLQQLYNQFIAKCHNPNMNMLYCDNFSDQIYLQMLAQIEKLLPNLDEFKVFEVTKIRLGKIVKAGILMLHLNGKYVRNISQIVMFDDCEKIGEKKKIKTFTSYDLYYEVFEKLVVE